MSPIIRAIYTVLEQIFGRRRVVDLNLILVARDLFTNAERQEVNDALQITRNIYDDVRLTVGTVRFFQISSEEAGNHAVIDSGSEADDLTRDWTVKNDALDVFVVRSMNGADGWSAVDGPCNKNAKRMNGSVISLNGNAANSGNTMAHEIGHYLGLNHITAKNNFIGGGGGSNSWTGIFLWQGWIMKSHCFVRNP